MHTIHSIGEYPEEIKIHIIGEYLEEITYYANPGAKSLVKM